MLIGAPLKTDRSVIVDPSRFSSQLVVSTGLRDFTLIPASRSRVIQTLLASKKLQNCVAVMEGWPSFAFQKKEMRCRFGSFLNVSMFSTFSDSITVLREEMFLQRGDVGDRGEIE
jgi:hypothetical protein